MSKREYRRFSAESKVGDLKVAEQPGVSVSAMCRKNSLSPSVAYAGASSSYAFRA